jgi:hypothetical protein
MTGASDLGSFLKEYKVNTQFLGPFGGYLSKVKIGVVPISPMQRLLGFVNGDVSYADVRVGPFPFWKQRLLARDINGNLLYVYPHTMEYRCASCEDSSNGSVFDIKNWLQDFLKNNWRGEEFKPGFGLTDPILAWTSFPKKQDEYDPWQYIDEDFGFPVDNSCENPLFEGWDLYAPSDEGLYPAEGILRWDGDTEIENYKPCFFYSPCYKARPPGMWDTPEAPTMHIPCTDPISANACPVYVNEEYRKCRAARKAQAGVKEQVDVSIQDVYELLIRGAQVTIPTPEEVVISWCSRARRIYQFDGRWWVEDPSTGKLWFGGDWYESPNRGTENLRWIPYIPGLGVPVGTNNSLYEGDSEGCNVMRYLYTGDRDVILLPKGILSYELEKWLVDEDLWYAPPEGFVLADQSDCGS